MKGKRILGLLLAVMLALGTLPAGLSFTTAAASGTDGKTIAEIPFTYGQKSVDLPAIPAKTGYTGAWPAYTLGAENITITAVYTPNTYTVRWVVDGKTTTTSVNFGQPITKPADPVKEGYTFKGWTPAVPATMPAKDLTFTAVFERNEVKEPTVNIKNFTANKTVDYKTTIAFTAEVKNAVSGVAVHWFIDGKDAGTGDKYTVTKAKKSFSVQAKYIKDGKILAESGVEKVNVRTDFFAKLLAFFCMLFGSLPKVVQGYLGVETIEKFIP